MPCRNFKNIEIWTLVTHMIISMMSSLIRNKLVFLKSTYSWKTSHNLKNPCIKVVSQLNLEKKEKIGDHGVTLLNSQATIKICRKHPYFHPLNYFAYPLIKTFSKNIFVEGLYTKTTSAIIWPIYIFEGSVLY